MMRKVYVCAPLGGDVESNLKKVRTYTEYALRCSTAPVVRISMRNVLTIIIPKTVK